MLTREEIIKAVQKWSKNNFGLTPSEKIIRDDLGIPRWHWTSFWVKVTDLQREAGLKPQDFDNSRYTNEELCKIFIKVIREEGKIPSRALLDFKHKQNSEFPGSGTFYKRLGLHRDGSLVVTIHEYVKDKRGYKDIITLCNSYLEGKEDIELENGISTNGKGYVYLLKTKLRNSVAYKIGKTKDIKSRIRQLRQESNIDELIHHIETDDMDGVENYWHIRFKDKRLYPERDRDEWYLLSTSDEKTFKRWKRIF